jgi:hypothetical protein
VGFPWANLPGGNALHAWDFLNNTALWNSASVGALSNTPGWTFTRASTGYAQNAAGLLLPFASGELRRTDKGVLIEGARTNICTNYSANPDAGLTNVGFTNASNTLAVFSRVDDTAALAAAGLSGACTSGFVFSLDNTLGDTTANARPTGSTTAAAHEYSVYARIVSGSGANLGRSATGTGAVTISGSTYSRFTVNLTPGAGETMRIQAPAGCKVYFILNQLEAGAFGSSVIPTSGASATRAADVLTVPVSGIDYPISLFAEFEPAVLATANARLFTIGVANTNSARLSLSSSTNLVRGQIDSVSGGGAQMDVTIAGAVSVGTAYKTALRTATNDSRHVRNGTLGTLDSSVTAPATPTSIVFGNDFTGGEAAFSYLRRCALWTRALTDSELQSVTT